MVFQCEKEMSIIDVCRKVARERNAKTVLRFAPKTSHQSHGFVVAVHGHIQGLARCYQTNWDEHWRTTFSNFTCLSICNSLRWIYSLKIHSATRRQNPISMFAWNSICITFVHVWWIGICFDSRSRSARSQTDEQVDKWFLVGTKCIVRRTPGGDACTSAGTISTWNAKPKSARKSTQDWSFLVRDRKNSRMCGMRDSWSKQVTHSWMQVISKCLGR